MASSSAVSDGNISIGATNGVDVYPRDESMRIVKVSFMVKGGGVSDLGLTYRMNCEMKFSRVYIDYARKTNMRPSKLILRYRNRVVSPEETPFSAGMVDNDLVLAYNENEDGVVVRPPPAANENNRVFVVQDLMTMPSIWRMTVPVGNSCACVYRGWAEIHGMAPNSVILYHNGKALKANLTMEEAQIHDGDLLYGYVYNP